MAAHTDLFTFGLFSGKPLKEQVTPHKLAVIVLINEYCSMKKSDSVPSPPPILRDDSYADQSYMDGSKPKHIKFTEKEKRNFMVTILQLLQASNLTLRDLCIKVKDKMKPELYTIFCKRLEEFMEEGVGAINDYFQNIAFLLDQPVITKTSVLGLFIWRMVLAFDKLSFSQMTELYTRFQSYYNASHLQQQDYEESQNFGGSLTDSVMSLSGVRFSRGAGRSLDPFQLTTEKKFSEESGGFSSQRQAEYFILQQMFLLQHNENEALPPTELQDKITDMLKANPAMAEAHFLSFLNNLRVKEYCTALHNLIHYFDRKTSFKELGQPNQGQGSKVKDETVPHRYAALNLAAFLYRFGNKKEAMTALTEAISMAQDMNDLVCLQHLLGWLHRLGEQGTARTENLLERAVAKSSELNLPNLTSISIQAFSRHNAFATAKPAQVFEYLQRSDVLNCQHSQSGFMCTSYANKAALWKMYGKRECTSMMSQLILNLDTSEGGVYYNGESVCIALCNIARLHADNGQYGLAIDLINTAKKRFHKNSQHAHIWMRSEQEILFDRTVLNKRLAVAEQAVLNLQAIDKTESDLRCAILNKEKGDVNTALKQLHSLIDSCGDEERDSQSADFICRVLLVLAEVYSQTGSPTNAVSYALECVTEARKHHLEYLAALAMMQLAYIQFQMKLPEQGLTLLTQTMLAILSHGTKYDQGRLLYCYAKCHVAAAARKGHEEKKAALLSSINVLNTVIELFQSVEAFLRVKDALYYQARLYHDLGYTSERNKCAYQCKQLDSQYPTLSQQSVNVL